MLNTTDKIIKHKTGLLNLAEELGNVSKACQMMGYSRDTFYRYKSAVDEGGVEALMRLRISVGHDCWSHAAVGVRLWPPAACRCSAAFGGTSAGVTFCSVIGGF